MEGFLGFIYSFGELLNTLAYISAVMIFDAKEDKITLLLTFICVNVF